MRINCIKKCLEHSFIRFLILLLMGELGVIIHCYMPDSFWENFFKSTSIYHMQTLTIGIPVFLTLWFFRTYDTRQAIAKSDEQILQNKFFNGLENITSEDQLKIEIGVLQLREISKIDRTFNEDIRLTFIKRIKKCPLKSDKIIKIKDSYHGTGVRDKMSQSEYGIEEPEPGTRLTYAQYILQWLIAHPHTKHGLDLSGSDFSNQDFKIKDLQLGKIFTRENKSYNCVFVRTDLRHADLKKVYLVRANMHSANLGHSQLECADLSGAELTYARPFNASINSETKGLDGYSVKLDKHGKMRIDRQTA